MWTIEQTSIGRIVIPPHVPGGFAVFATTRDFEGRLSAETAERIRAVVRARFALGTDLRTCSQVHGAKVERATPGEPWSECGDCDALWSDAKGTALAIKVADCLPVTVVDPVHSVIANVHSGWRGAAAGITDAALGALEREATFAPADAFAYLGPSIRACCFEVGEEVAARFDARWVLRSGSRIHGDESPGHVDGERPHVDIPGFTRDVLRRRGFDGDRIFDSGLCTRCEPSDFHSYRRHGAEGGRNLAIVAQ